MMNANASSFANIQDWGTVWPQCVARAWQDMDFREALKRDPAGTLSAHYQVSLPQGLDLRVIESGEEPGGWPPNAVRMVIPPAPELDAQGVALHEGMLAHQHGPSHGPGPRPFPFSCFC